ncbi:MAG: hypothetical protein R3B07_10015 [Polyangiaceae bacterium]
MWIASTPMVPDDEDDVDRDEVDREEEADSDVEASSARDVSTGARSKQPSEDADDDDFGEEEEEDEAPPPKRKRAAAAKGEDEDDEEDEESSPPKRKRPVVDDADEDDEDDEDDDDEDEDEDAAELARRRRAKRRAQRLKVGKKRRKKRVKRPPLPHTEAELDSPNRSTTFMIWTLVAVTLVLWGFARTACNFNPPQVDKPKLAELDVLAREPKDAALEFEIRLREHRFEIAQKLAAKAGEAIVAQAKQACGAGCPEIEHGKILCEGAVMARSAAGATVRVGCQSDGKWEYKLLTLVRDGNEWRVSAREDGQAPPPVGATAAPPTTAIPTGLPTALAPSAAASAAKPPLPEKPAPIKPAPPGTAP